MLMSGPESVTLAALSFFHGTSVLIFRAAAGYCRQLKGLNIDKHVKVVIGSKVSDYVLFLSNYSHVAGSSSHLECTFDGNRYKIMK